MATVLRPPVVSRQQPAAAPGGLDTWRNAALLASLAVLLPAAQFSDTPPSARPAAQQPTQAPNLLAGPLVVQAPQPFAQADWPNPRSALYPSDNRGYIETAPPFFLLTGAKPALQSDWPVPRGATFAWWAQQFALARNLVPFSVPVGLRLDQPNPRGATFPSDLRGFLYAPTPTALLTGTKPFLQPDWPLAPRRAAPIPQGDFASAILVLSSIAPNPFAQRDWPNPLGPLQPSDLRTFFSQGPAPLQGGGAAPVGRSAFEVPTRVRSGAPQSDAEQGSPLTILPTGAAPVPFFPPHAFNPVARAFIPLADAEQGSPLALLPFGLPFTPADFPNPLRARPVPQADSLGRAHLLAAVIPAPFAQTDWPNPRGFAQPTGLIWASGPPMPFTGGAAPIGQASTELPPRAPRPLLAVGWTVSLQTTTLAPAVSLPIGQQWLVPAAAAPGRVQLEQQPAAALRAFGVYPVGESSTETPRAPTRAPVDWRVAPFLGLYAPVVLPFGQDDWPVPRGPAIGRQGGIEARGASLALAATGGIKPFAQTDWPLPPRAKPPVPIADFWPALFTTTGTNLVTFVYGNWRTWFIGYRQRSATFDARARVASLGAVMAPAIRGRAWMLSEDYVLTLEKRSSENVIFDLDFSQMLGTGETISSVSSIAADSGPAVALVFGAPAINNASPITYTNVSGALDHVAPIGTVVQVAISGGGIPTGSSVCDYIVRCKVVTSRNVLVEGTAKLRVNDTPVA